MSFSRAALTTYTWDKMRFISLNCTATAFNYLFEFTAIDAFVEQMVKTEKKVKVTFTIILSIFFYSTLIEIHQDDKLKFVIINDTRYDKWPPLHRSVPSLAWVSPSWFLFPVVRPPLLTHSKFFLLSSCYSSSPSDSEQEQRTPSSLMSRRSLRLDDGLLDRRPPPRGSASLVVGGASWRSDRPRRSQRNSASCSESLLVDSPQNAVGQFLHNSSVNSVASDASLISSLLDESSIQESTLVETFWGNLAASSLTSSSA